MTTTTNLLGMLSPAPMRDELLQQFTQPGIRSVGEAVDHRLRGGVEVIGLLAGDRLLLRRRRWTLTPHCTNRPLKRVSFCSGCA